MRSSQTLTIGKLFMYPFYVLANLINIEYLLYLCFLDCTTSQMAKIFNNGQVMTQRHS